MKNKYFISWQYSYEEYPTDRFEKIEYHGMQFTRAYKPFICNGSNKSVVELDNNMSSTEWERFIRNFESEKEKSILAQDINHRNHVQVSISGINKL